MWKQGQGHFSGRVNRAQLPPFPRIVHSQFQGFRAFLTCLARASYFACPDENPSRRSEQAPESSRRIAHSNRADIHDDRSGWKEAASRLDTWIGASQARSGNNPPAIREVLLMWHRSFEKYRYHR